jgi:hypothetical protein
MLEKKGKKSLVSCLVVAHHFPTHSIQGTNKGIELQIWIREEG